jgi:hypothetical protein
VFDFDEVWSVPGSLDADVGKYIGDTEVVLAIDPDAFGGVAFLHMLEAAEVAAEVFEQQTELAMVTFSTRLGGL